MRDPDENRTNDVDELRKLIKQGGHWRVQLQPAVVNPNRLNISELLPTVATSAVRLRGWDFPHFGKTQNVVINAKFLEAWTFWRFHEEVWRFYTSGQFAFLSGFKEDNELSYGQKVESSIADIIPDSAQLRGFLDTVGVTWTILEVVAFAARLSMRGVLEGGAVLRIWMKNVENYALGFSTYDRHFRHVYACRDQEILLERNLSTTELTTGYREVAASLGVEALRRFSMSATDALVKGMQEELLPANRTL